MIGITGVFALTFFLLVLLHWFLSLGRPKRGRFLRPTAPRGTFQLKTKAVEDESPNVSQRRDGPHKETEGEPSSIKATPARCIIAAIIGATFLSAGALAQQANEIPPKPANAAVVSYVIALPSRSASSTYDPSAELEPKSSEPKWHYGGFVDFGYLLDFNHPLNHLFRSRGTTFHVDNLFVNMAGAYAKKKASEQSRWAPDQ